MSPQAVFCGIVAVVCFVFTWLAIKEGEDRAALVALLIGALFGYWSYQGTTPEHLAEVKADTARAEAAERREQTPHVIREADGCKVYAWKGGDRYHYFTRCPASTTVTDQHWQQCTGSGKTRSCKEMTESIEVKP
jgi:hypothetical protein